MLTWVSANESTVVQELCQGKFVLFENTQSPCHFNRLFVPSCQKCVIGCMGRVHTIMKDSIKSEYV